MQRTPTNRSSKYATSSVQPNQVVGGRDERRCSGLSRSFEGTPKTVVAQSGEEFADLRLDVSGHQYLNPVQHVVAHAMVIPRLRGGLPGPRLVGGADAEYVLPRRRVPLRRPRTPGEFAHRRLQLGIGPRRAAVAAEFDPTHLQPASPRSAFDPVSARLNHTGAGQEVREPPAA